MEGVEVKGGVLFCGDIIYISPEAEFLDEIQAKGLRVFLLALQKHLCSFAFRFLFILTQVTSYSFYLHCIGKRKRTL